MDGKGSKTRSLKARLGPNLSGFQSISQADEEEHFNSTLVMRRILKLAFLNAIQRRHIRQHQKNIEVFEQAFATIKSTTGISDIEEIVKIFVALEQRNFSLLTYVWASTRGVSTTFRRGERPESRDRGAGQAEPAAEGTAGEPTRDRVREWGAEHEIDGQPPA